MLFHKGAETSAVSSDGLTVELGKIEVAFELDNAVVSVALSELQCRRIKVSLGVTAVKHVAQEHTMSHMVTLLSAT